MHGGGRYNKNPSITLQTGSPGATFAPTNQGDDDHTKLIVLLIIGVLLIIAIAFAYYTKRCRARTVDEESMEINAGDMALQPHTSYKGHKSSTSCLAE